MFFHSVWGDLEGVGTCIVPPSSYIQKPRTIRVNDKEHLFAY